MKKLIVLMVLLNSILFFVELNAQNIDQSDKKLSIIVPKAFAGDIDFVKVLKNSIKDSVFAGYIKNTGKTDVRIDKIEIKGKDAGDFALITNVFPFTIKQGNNKNIEFRFKPKSTGSKIATVVIITQTDTLTNSISGDCVEPRIAVITDIIDFGKIPLYLQSDKIIESAIKNIGTSPLKITSVAIANLKESQFSIIEEIKPFDLNPGDNKSIKVRFNPNQVGRTNSKIIISYENSTEPESIQLYGEGSPVFATIKGTVKDAGGNPIDANIGWELMSENKEYINVELGNAKSSGTDGSYEFKLPIGKNYGYFFKKQGYANVNETAQLEKNKLETTIVKNIIMKKPCDATIRISVFFDYNKSELKPASFSDLDRLVILLKENPDLKVEISGHTDNVGNDSYNLELSTKRAGSVVAYLISKGCNQKMLETKGYGKTKPVATNNTDEGRAENRRVECKFLCK